MILSTPPLTVTALTSSRHPHNNQEEIDGDRYTSCLKFLEKKYTYYCDYDDGGDK